MKVVRSGRWAPEFCRAVAFLVLANMPFWLLSTHYFVERPVVNSDVFVAMAFWTVSAPLGALALGVVWAIDGLQSLSLAYHFRSVVDFAQGIRFGGEITWLDFLSPSLLAACALIAVAMTGICWLFSRWRPHWMPMAVIAGMLVAADLVNGSGLTPWFGRDNFLLPANISGSPGMNLVVTTITAEERASHPLRKLPPDGAPDIVDWAGRNGGNVLVVIVESLGQHQNRAIQDWLSARLVDDNIRSRWQVTQDQAPFEGSTTAGELRVLCRLGGHYTRLSASTAADCLPQRLARAGYATYGLHGFSSSMFNRKNWWPAMGLQDLSFGETMPADMLKCGGGFRGICDTAMVDWVEPLLTGERRLVYLLTLNTHLPLAPITLPADLVALCAAQQVGEAVCQLTGQLGVLFSRLNHLLRDVSQPPLVMVVGDHSPPFLGQAQRSQYATSAVPRYIMVPK